MGGLGIFGIPSYISPKGIDNGFYGAIISIIVSFILGFVIMFLVGLGDEEKENNISEEKSNKSLVKQEEVVSPFKGKVLQLSEVNDEAFSSGALGKGVAIKPSNGKVIAPVDGTVTTLFPTGHAIGITSKNGAEILIHIGMDTVKLEGKYFTPKVKQGDEIKLGQELLEFDVKAIENEGYSLVSPVIITNSNSYLDIIETDKKEINYKENLLTVMI
jgi:PTS system beta-glucosides-specific IIC component